MFLFAIGILAILVSLVSLIYVIKKCKHGTYPKQKQTGLIVSAAAVVAGVLLIGADCVTTIPRVTPASLPHSDAWKIIRMKRACI